MSLRLMGDLCDVILTGGSTLFVEGVLNQAVLWV